MGSFTFLLIVWKFGENEPMRSEVSDETLCPGVDVQWFAGRDLTPSNIVVRSDCTLKILDFGLARSAGTPPTTLTAVVV